MKNLGHRFSWIATAGLLLIGGFSSAANAQVQYPISQPPTVVPATVVPGTPAPAAPAKPADPTVAPSSVPATVLPAVLTDPPAAPAAIKSNVLAETVSRPAFTGSNATLPLSLAGAAFVATGAAFLIVGRRSRRRHIAA